MAAGRTPEFWIRASPRGTRSGFVVLPDGAGGRLTLTVLPKPWSDKTPVIRYYDHAPGATTHVVMHETELVALSTTAATVGSLTMSLIEVSRGQADLLTLGAPPDNPRSATAVVGDPFRELIDLMLLAERGRLMGSPLTFEGAFGPSLLRLLTQERLLTLVESLIFRVRPRYAERTETLEMPRGRLNDRSLLYSLATGTPRVESIFDELTTDTPLLQVVASALRVVGSDRFPRKIASLRPGLQTRAVHLLRYLSSVTLIDREQALLVAERLWIGPLDRIWKPAIDASIQVLQDWAVQPEPGDDSSEALLVHISTEKFWEQCMESALENAFRSVVVSRDGQADSEVSVPAPWFPRADDGTKPYSSPTTSHPDFIFQCDQRVVVADAKYKLGTHNLPTSADGYQLFAYSHLATLREQPSELAVLLYPAQVGSRPKQLELERLRTGKYPLWLASLPFPTRIDIQSRANWATYIARLAGIIRDLSAEWKRPHSAAP